MKSIPVFYSPKLVAKNYSISPSSGKPALVVESWQELGVPIIIREPIPVTVDELCYAHGRPYVEKVLACRANNGFGDRSSEVATSLPYTTGAFVCAAREALRNGKVSVAPVSGFHHASENLASGFCTFNGLVVAAQVLKKEGLVNKVGILDFDQHYGDGTVDIIRARQLGDWLFQYSAGKDYRQSAQAEEFLQRIPDLVSRFANCDIIFYQAGADPHIADPLGGWLTTAQLAERDRLVFKNARSWGIPIAWNLAGGYQNYFRGVLNIHDNTLRVCWDVYGNKKGYDHAQ